ncbi:MAG: mobilization protein [Prochloraceae cyanobacterium]
MNKDFNDRIKQLEEKKQQINARIQKLKAQESEKKRKQETRRKILLGSWVLNKIEFGDWSKEDIWNEMDKYLTKEVDRKLFDLPNLDKEEN